MGLYSDLCSLNFSERLAYKVVVCNKTLINVNVVSLLFNFCSKLKATSTTITVVQMAREPSDTQEQKISIGELLRSFLVSHESHAAVLFR